MIEYTNMKRILILCRHDERPEYDQVVTYRAALESSKRKNEYTFGELEDIVFSYGDGNLSVTLHDDDISSFDGLFLIGWFKTKMLEDVALSVATYMHHQGRPVLNSEALYTRSRSKLSQYVVGSLNGIPIAPFVFCMNKKILQSEIQKQYIRYPLVAKAVQASRGNDNYLVNTELEALSVIDKTDQVDGPWFVLQGFVPNDGDLRIIVMGDEVKYVLHRKAVSGSHLNNTSKGGEATELLPEELSQSVREDAVKLARLLKREVTGVDMIQHSETGEYYLLEINNMPQMATGSMVEKKISLLDEYFEAVVADKSNA